MSTNRFIKAKIHNCKSCNIIADPTTPETQEVIIGSLKAGDEVLVDLSEIFWSWDDKTYYKVDYGTKPEEGYINTGVVKVV